MEDKIMKRFKKITAIMTAVVLVMSFAACGNDSKTKDSNATSNSYKFSN